MKSILSHLARIFLLFFLIPSSGLIAQEQTYGSMNDYFASPVVEDGKRNIILQNRCGNRLTLLMYEDKTILEFVYKPNAFRRKDYKARNFSNRDNFTLLFKEVKWPMINSSNIVGFDYDPFYTRLEMKNQWDAENVISIVNIAKENAFAVAAETPLLIAIRPHTAFDVKDGLLTEKFIDRGEEIVSFIAFDNFVQNRFRILQDGTCVIQIFENELVFFGGEENEFQVQEALLRLKNKSLTELVRQNELELEPKMDQGRVYYSNPDFQKVIDINHRVAYSGMDEGGACFGALNRIYYLIWVRDGSMTSSLMARAGNPEFIKIWTRFLLNNPSSVRPDDKEAYSEFLQIVGSRWTRSEDDGMFYAALSLFSYYKTTGEDDLLQGKEFQILLSAVDRYLEKTWKNEKKLMISNTIGETPLKADPYFGYDVVNGNFENNQFHKSQGKELSLNASLYNQVNTYNILMMASDLLSQRPDLDNGRKEKYLTIAGDIKETIHTKFYDKVNDCLFSSLEFYTDGTEGTLSFKADDNPWEGSWANAVGPYFPAPELQLKTARFIYKTWPVITKQGYGYCPWNTLSKVLTEYGLPSDEYERMLSPEIKDALSLTVKYPMPGALTEYNRQIEGWRALPFSAGSLFFSMVSQMITSLPDGIAVRANSKIDSITNYRYKLSSIQANGFGKGDIVDFYVLNGDTIFNSLQIPDNLLYAGRNTLKIIRAEKSEKFRLFSSTAKLLSISGRGKTLQFKFISTIPTQILFEHVEMATLIEIKDSHGNKVEYTAGTVNNSKITLIDCNPEGFFTVTVTL